MRWTVIHNAPPKDPRAWKRWEKLFGSLCHCCILNSEWWVVCVVLSVEAYRIWNIYISFGRISRSLNMDLCQMTELMIELYSFLIHLFFLFFQRFRTTNRYSKWMGFQVDSCYYSIFIRFGLFWKKTRVSVIYDFSCLMMKTFVKRWGLSAC